MHAINIVFTVYAVIMLLFLVALALAPLFGWKIAAKHKEFVTFQSQQIPRAKIRDACAEQGWTLVRDEPGEMVARTRFNCRSWGEVVSMSFHDGGADVKSECSFIWQGVDYGKNRMNVRRLTEALKRKNA